MGVRRQNYVYGTAARNLEPDVQEQRKVSKKKVGTRVSNKSKIKVLLHVMFCCALALVMMYRYCLLTEMNYGISKKYDEYEKLKNKNISLKVAIEKEQNLSNIKEIACNRLNMRNARKDQIVYIKVPTNDFVKYVKSEEKGGILNFALRKLESLRNYF